jgi:hypothetical protein
LPQCPRKYIERRYNRVFTKPTAEERRQIEVALHDFAGLRDEAFLEQVCGSSFARATVPWHVEIEKRPKKCNGR